LLLQEKDSTGAAKGRKGSGALGERFEEQEEEVVRYEELSIQDRPAAIVLYDLVDDKYDRVVNQSTVAAVDDTTAVLDSCSLKHGSRVSPSVKYEGA
jgi:hypothetical protein